MGIVVRAGAWFCCPPMGLKKADEATVHGAMGAATRLDYSSKQWRDEDMAQLCKAIASGSLGALEVLSLHENKIGDAGMDELSNAISSGSLPNLQNLFIDSP